MKIKKGYFIASFMIVISIISFMVFGEDVHNDMNILFLNSYGWEVDTVYCDKSNIIIPQPFDMVYESYNKLQLEAGLDLTPYQGKNAIRYTYKVNNYPIDVHDTVYANVIVANNTCIGGDIMTIPLDGFMHSLAYIPITN